MGEMEKVKPKRTEQNVNTGPPVLAHAPATPPDPLRELVRLLARQAVHGEIARIQKKESETER